MKIILLISLFILGCSTTNKNQIKMPTVAKKVTSLNEIISEAVKTKIRIGEKSGFVFDFFYGPKGSYFIVVTAKNNRNLNLNEYDVFLNINSEDLKSPESISLIIEDKQVLSGFGDVREGPTSFELIFEPVDTSLNKSFKFNFKSNIIMSL